MYDDDEEVDDDIKRYDNIAREGHRQARRAVQYAGAGRAGGTVPEFGPDGALRPQREDGDDDTDNDGIPNDFDPFDNEHPRTRHEAGPPVRRALREGGPLHPVTIPKASR